MEAVHEGEDDQPPIRGLASEKDVAINSCSDATAVNTADTNWMVERFAYDLPIKTITHT